MNPVNPYGSSKAFQDIVSQVYQRSFGLSKKAMENLFLNGVGKKILKQKSSLTGQTRNY